MTPPGPPHAATLAGAALTRTDLAGANLRWVNLTEAWLSGASWTGDTERPLNLRVRP